MYARSARFQVNKYCGLSAGSTQSRRAPPRPIGQGRRSRHTDETTDDDPEAATHRAQAPDLQRDQRPARDRAPVHRLEAHRHRFALDGLSGWSLFRRYPMRWRRAWRWLGSEPPLATWTRVNVFDATGGAARAANGAGHDESPCIPDGQGRCSGRSRHYRVYRTRYSSQARSIAGRSTACSR